MANEWQEIPLTEWQAEGTKRFGTDINDWAYVCPSCGHRQTRKDWMDLGMNPRQVDERVGYSCIGRWLSPREAVPAFEMSKGLGCNYIGSHRPNISPITIIISTDPKIERPTFGWG